MISTAVALLIRSAAPSGTRISPATDTTKLTADQLPRIMYTLLAGDKRYSDDGNSGLTQARYQIDYFGAKNSDAEALSARIAANWTGQPGTGIDGYKGTLDGTKIERVYFEVGQFQQGDKTEGASATIARYFQNLIVEYRE